MKEASLVAVLRVIVLGTGHAAMWAVTLGRWKPTNSRDHLATLVGLLLLTLLVVSTGLALCC
jgi:glucose dehydrogenase